MSITVDVGKIKLVWRGTYNSGTSYEVDDLVQYDDGSAISAYICVAPTTGNVPSTAGTVNTTYWNLVAKGASAASGGTSDGQVQYKSGVGFAATSSLTYDPTNLRLGINTSSPQTTLQVVGVTSLSNLTVSSPLSLPSSLIVTGITTLGVTTVTDTLRVEEVLEKVNVVAGTANGTSNLDVKTGSVFLFTSNSTATWTHNIRGDASTSLDSFMNVGQSITVVVISKQNSISYYTSSLNIDGSSRTVNWIANSTPSSGQSTAGYDTYTWNIVKTGSNAYVIIASQVRFG